MIKILAILMFFIAFSCTSYRSSRKPSSTLASSQCSYDIKSIINGGEWLFSPYLGEPYDKYYSISGYKVFRLGWGADANSLRVVSKHDSSTVFTRKVFNSDEEDQFYSPGARDRELRRFKFIEEVMKDCIGESSCFNLVKLSGTVGEDVIDFEYIPGRTLQWLVKEETISADSKRAFQERYKEYSLKIIDQIQKNYGDKVKDFRVMKWLDAPKDFPYESYFISIESDEAMLRAGFDPEVKIWLKPDNILISPDTGQMTLIDPY